MNNVEIVEKFYQSFAKGNVKDMIACYHKEVVFQDPAFGKLKGERAGRMWQMLLSGSSEPAKISFSNIEATHERGSASWKAQYYYGPKNRKVTNLVEASFKFKDGKIIEHIDTFNLWKWTQQALGPIGYLMGWTPFMKIKIQKMTNQKLDDYIGKNSE